MLDQTTGTNYTKRVYTPEFIENFLTAREDAMMKSVTKKKSDGGQNNVYFADCDDTFCVSPDFPTAQTAAINQGNIGAQFVQTWCNVYGVAQLSSGIIGVTKNDDAAWTRALDVVMTKTVAAMGHFHTLAVLGQGWGELASITGISGSTFKLNDPSSIRRFVKGMPLVFAADLHTSALDSATVLYVTKVDYTGGVVTMSAALSTVSASNNDWAFVAGARKNATSLASSDRLVPAGLDAMVPNQTSGTPSDATITSIGGYDRSQTTRLYGTFVNGTGGGSLLNYLITSAQTASTVGNATRLDYYLSVTNFTNVAQDLHASVRYVDNGAAGNKTVGTRGLQIYADGNVQAFIHVSRTARDQEIFGMADKSLVLRSVGDAVHMMNEDGLTMARVYNAAAYEVRWETIFQIEVQNPAAMCRIQVQTAV